jgi:predicted Zn-dependent protease
MYMLLGYPSARRPVSTAALTALVILLSPPLAQTQSKPAARSKAASQSTSISASDAATLRKALDAYDRGDLKAAEPILQELSARYPKNYEANEALGSLYAESDDITHAMTYLERAASVAPGQAIAHANLGAAYLKLGRNKDAVHELRIAAASDSANRITQSNLGRALLADKQPAEAALAFAAAVSIEPANSDLRYNWAVALLDAGQTTAAADALAPVAEQESMSQVQALLGDIAERQGKLQDAVQHLQNAAKLDPSEANIYFLGFEFLRHWTFEPAIKIFEFGITKYPASQRMRMGLGIARYSMNDPALAAPIFAQLLDDDPDSATYADFLGKSCNLMPDMSTGCEKLESFAEKHPKNATIATYAAASILHRSNQTEDLSEAGRLLDQAITRDPKLSEAHLQKGLLLQQQGHWMESVAELQTAIALKPEASKAHYRLALAYSHTGQREKAQDEIALQQKYSEQEKDGLNARLKEVKTFLVTEK